MIPKNARQAMASLSAFASACCGKSSVSRAKPLRTLALYMFGSQPMIVATSSRDSLRPAKPNRCATVVNAFSAFAFLGCRRCRIGMAANAGSDPFQTDG